MSEEDANALQNAYGYYLQDNGVLKLRSDLTDAERTALEEAVTTPDIVLYMAAAQNANALPGRTLPPWLRCPAIRAKTRLPGMKQKP